MVRFRAQASPVAPGEQSPAGAPAARIPPLLLTFVVGSALVACEPKLVVGQWSCAQNDAGAALTTDPLASPWATSFENPFCDYAAPAGFCFSDSGASYRIVASPVHSGQFAAAFDVNSAQSSSYQARCVRQGGLPPAAYYGAWYYIPALVTNRAVWNLFHFQGGTPPLHGLWDVSLINDANGDLQTVVFDFLGGTKRGPVNPPPIPIGTWFHLQFYLKRAANATGEIALYQDGRMLTDVTNIVTDDSTFGQWYVGNYADGLEPADSTLYVDDVTIGPTL